MKRDEIIQYLKNLRSQIIAEFEKIEGGEKFQQSAWNYNKGNGGGEINQLRGNIFERAAVNWSGVSGEKFPLDESRGPFFATGVSLITHMKNPKAPTVHFNVRYIEAGGKWWLGGGYDLTPMGFPISEDTQHFHQTAQKSLDAIDKEYYPKYKKWASEYFFIPHRQKERGVGGIFFDYVNSGDEKKDWAMWKAVAESFLPAILPIYKKRILESYNDKDRDTQLIHRGHYVEYNLLYDRGTKFGFQSGGNHEAILCSMPPLAKW